MHVQPRVAPSGREVAVLLLLAAMLGVPGSPGAGVAAQRSSGTRAFTIHGNHYAFEPSRIDVVQDDLVTITFQAEDIAHSFTLDEYRISKRAAAGQSVTFEFRADRAGTFPFYCDLRFDSGCRKMHGQLVVRPR